MIRVNSVHPGVIDTLMGQEVVTGFSSALGVGDNDARTQLAARHPLGHFGRDSNIADAIVFLLSERAAAITGQALVVDAGASA